MNPKNLRAISLLSNISKVFETYIKNNLVEVFRNINLINDRQFGFRLQFEMALNSN